MICNGFSEHNNVGFYLFLLTKVLTNFKAKSTLNTKNSDIILYLGIKKVKLYEYFTRVPTTPDFPEQEGLWL